jgi:hypothetical protein
MYMFHVLNDIRSPTVTFFEIRPWTLRRGSIMLPVLNQPDPLNAPTVIIRPGDICADTVLFLDAIAQDLATGGTHSLISVDPLPIGDLTEHPVEGCY